MKDEHYQEYTEDFLLRQEKQRKKLRNTVFILGWSGLVLAAYTAGTLISLLADRPWSLIISGAVGYAIGYYGGRYIRLYAKSRGLTRTW